MSVGGVCVSLRICLLGRFTIRLVINLPEIEYEKTFFSMPKIAYVPCCWFCFVFLLYFCSFVFGCYNLLRAFSDTYVLWVLNFVFYFFAPRIHVPHILDHKTATKKRLMSKMAISDTNRIIVCPAFQNGPP